MTELPRFSPWCQLCLDGDPRPDAHQRHVLHAQRVRRAQFLERRKQSPWQWKLEDTKEPLPEEFPRGKETA